MKSMENIFTGIAIMVLIIMGIYLLTRPKTIDNNPNGFTTIIDGEEVISEYPIVESFSNEQSNRKVIEEQKAKANSQKTIKAPQPVLTQPFTLGLYYIDTIAKKGGVEYCTPRPGTDTNYVLYDERSEYVIKDVTLENEQAYVFVETNYIPKNLCAYMMQFRDIPNNIFKAIHIVFKK